MRSAALAFIILAAAPAAAQDSGGRDYLPVPQSLPEAMLENDTGWMSLRGIDGEPVRIAVPDAAMETVLAPPAEPELPETPAAEDAAPTAAEPAEEPAAPSNAEVTVIVEGVESANGTVNVAVCKGLSRETCQYTTEVSAAAGFVEARFKDIPPGRYAVVGYHDANANSTFDRFLGVPREPFALSNKANEKMVPGFEDAAVDIGAGDNTFVIRLGRVLGG